MIMMSDYWKFKIADAAILDVVATSFQMSGKYSVLIVNVSSILVSVKCKMVVAHILEFVATPFWYHNYILHWRLKHQIIVGGDWSNGWENDSYISWSSRWSTATAIWYFIAISLSMPEVCLH